MQQPDVQTQVDDLKKRVDDLEGKVNETLEAVREMQCAMGKGRPEFMGWGEGVRRHGYPMMYGKPRWPMAGMYFFITMLAIGALLASMGRLRGYPTWVAHEHYGEEYKHHHHY